MKKRRAETARAKTQQRQRRRKTLFRKAAEFCLECESDIFVAVRIRKTGQLYLLDSSSLSQWIATLSNLVQYTQSTPLRIKVNISRHHTTLLLSRRDWRILCPRLSLCQSREIHHLFQKNKKGIDWVFTTEPVLIITVSCTITMPTPESPNSSPIPSTITLACIRLDGHISALGTNGHVL